MAILRGKLLEALRFNESSSKIRFASPLATDPKKKLSVLLLMGSNGMGTAAIVYHDKIVFSHLCLPVIVLVLMRSQARRRPLQH